MKITAKTVKQLEPRATKYIAYDDETKGFGVRVEPSGMKSFIRTYRNATRTQRRITIGRHPDWAVAVARKKAEELRARISRGEDPLAARKTVREAPTLADLAEEYIARHLPTKRPRSQEEDLRLLRVQILPALKNVKVADVDHQTVAALHSKITKRGTPPTGFFQRCSLCRSAGATAPTTPALALCRTPRRTGNDTCHRRRLSGW